MCIQVIRVFFVEWTKKYEFKGKWKFNEKWMRNEG